MCLVQGLKMSEKAANIQRKTWRTIDQDHFKGKSGCLEANIKK